jgi:hypothetical protein
MDPHDICAVLDAFTEGGPVCGHTGLFRGGAAAMCAAICECADDLREAEELLAEGDTPEVAVLILRRVADECQQFARTTDIAIRTGAARRSEDALYAKAFGRPDTAGLDCTCAR